MKAWARMLAMVVLAGIFIPAISYAAQVTLAWDANDPTPDGYHLYQREAGQSYNYSTHAWSGTVTTCSLEGLEEGVTYYFVVRAYKGSDESGG